jgi:hypothetical protein
MKPDRIEDWAGLRHVPQRDIFACELKVLAQSQ